MLISPTQIYKGKTDEGKEVTGYLYINSIHNDYISLYNPREDTYQVRPDTLKMKSPYIDMHGDNIYELDIIEVTGEDEEDNGHYILYYRDYRWQIFHIRSKEYYDADFLDDVVFQNRNIDIFK